jgi:hypothetical protein
LKYSLVDVCLLVVSFVPCTLALAPIQGISAFISPSKEFFSADSSDSMLTKYAPIYSKISRYVDSIVVLALQAILITLFGATYLFHRLVFPVLEAPKISRCLCLFISHDRIARSISGRTIKVSSGKPTGIKTS